MLAFTRRLFTCHSRISRWRKITRRNRRQMVNPRPHQRPNSRLRLRTRAARLSPHRFPNHNGQSRQLVCFRILLRPAVSWVRWMRKRLSFSAGCWRSILVGGAQAVACKFTGAQNDEIPADSGVWENASSQRAEKPKMPEVSYRI